MNQRAFRLSGIIVATLVLSAISPLPAQTGAKNGEWRTYGGDLGNTKYSPLDQINASNFNTLKLAWRFHTENLGPKPEARQLARTGTAFWWTTIPSSKPPSRT